MEGVEGCVRVVKAYMAMRGARTILYDEHYDSAAHTLVDLSLIMFSGS